MNYTKIQIAHALEQIKDNADALTKLGPSSSRARHCLFQLSYNVGRLSELTGLGRKFYDVVKPHVTSGNWAFVVVAVQELMEDFEV